MSHSFSFLFALILCLSFSPSFANESYKEKALKLNISNNKAWLRLLYYIDGKSEVENPDFFLSKIGRKDPQAELIANIEAIWGTDKPINDDHPLCQFPARFNLLSRLLGLSKESVSKKISNCDKFNNFLERSQPKSLALVFSSYYLHNPSSAFGHTLLKINRKGKSDEDLLGYGINYAATVDTDNALIYATKGIFGFFKGEFTAIPYYYKVREYNDFESRDLWSYELDLTDQEIELFMYHVWELGKVWSSYLYLTKNCSYWILRTLEAVSPRLELTKDLPALYVIPIDTVRAAIESKGLVKEVKLRPSLRQKVLFRFDNLNSTEIKNVKQIVKELYPSDKQDWNFEQYNAEFLDAAIDYYDYKWSREILDKEKEFIKKKRPLLLARSKKKDAVLQIETKKIEEEPPHIFHPSSQLQFFAGNRESDAVYGFGWKGAMQELFDPHIGFDAYSELNFFDLQFQYIDNEQLDDRLKLKKFDVVRVGALTPVTSLDTKMAWRFRTGIQELYGIDCQLCNSAFANAAFGVSWKYHNNSSFIYTLIQNQLDYSKRIEDSHLRFGIGPKIGLVQIWGDYFKSYIDYNYIYVDFFNAVDRDIWWVEHTHQYYLKDKDLGVGINGRHLKKADEITAFIKYFY